MWIFYNLYTNYNWTNPGNSWQRKPLWAISSNKKGVFHFPHVCSLPWSKLSSPQFTPQAWASPSPEWKRTWGMTKKSPSCRFQPSWTIWIIMGPSSPNRGRNSQNKLYALAFEIQNASNIRIFYFLTVQGNDTAHAMVYTISPCYSDM